MTSGTRPEDGTLDRRSALTVTPAENHHQRTKRTLQADDGAVIVIVAAKLPGGQAGTCPAALDPNGGRCPRGRKPEDGTGENRGCGNACLIMSNYLHRELPNLSTPAWLGAIEHGNNGAELPLREILAGSLYYPACGLNGTPVKYCAGAILSFIYADYGITKAEYLGNLNGTGEDSGFRGYHSVMQREVFKEDIVPSGWKPSLTPACAENTQRLVRQEAGCQPFGHWSVWDRDADREAAHGPERFSFLFFAGEMSAIYQGLFCRLGIAPRILAIIQPGSGLGGGWEQTESNASFFKKVVTSNRAGMPEYLLYGGFGRGFYEEPCWREYRGQRLVQLPERYAGLWRFNVGV